MSSLIALLRSRQSLIRKTQALSGFADTDSAAMKVPAGHAIGTRPDVHLVSSFDGGQTQFVRPRRASMMRLKALLPRQQRTAADPAMLPETPPWNTELERSARGDDARAALAMARALRSTIHHTRR